MQIIREYHYEFIEVSHDNFGIKLVKLWNFEVQFWVPVLKTNGNTEKSNMKMNQNLDSHKQEKFKCRSLENSTTSS